MPCCRCWPFFCLKYGRRVEHAHDADDLETFKQAQLTWAEMATGIMKLLHVKLITCKKCLREGLSP